jgi:PPOX class probable FMN-dependent enzyme
MTADILAEPIAPWRSNLVRAIDRHRSQPYSRFFQLATVTPEGKPKNRTVVFRGFLESTNYLQIITDARSKKIDDLQQQPQVEVCWYFTKTREQFRLAGKITIITATETNPTLQKKRQLIWQNLSDAAREQFTRAEPQQKRDKQRNSLIIADVSPIKPPSNFYLLLLKVDFVDHLELRGNPQNRWIYTSDEQNNWLVEEVNP